MDHTSQAYMDNTSQSISYVRYLLIVVSLICILDGNHFQYKS